MKTQLTIRILCLMALFLSITACQKEPTTESSKNLLAFETTQEYEKELERIGTMSDAEFSNWEKKNAFTSFYSLAKKAYGEIDLDSYQSQEEAIRAIEKHNQFLLLIPESNGDYTLETRLYNRSIAEQRILNKGRMVRIGSSIFKVFDNGIASGSEDQIMQLKNMSEEAFLTLESNKEIQVRRMSDKKDLFAKAHNDRIEDGRNRLYMGIEIQFTIPFTMGEYATSYSIEYTIRPYYRTLGIWGWTKEFFEGNISCEFSYSPNDPGSDIILNYNRRIPYEKRRVAEDRYLVESDHAANNFFYGFEWRKINCWATSAAVPGQTCRIDKIFN